MTQYEYDEEGTIYLRKGCAHMQVYYYGLSPLSVENAHKIDLHQRFKIPRKN